MRQHLPSFLAVTVFALAGCQNGDTDRSPAPEAASEPEAATEPAPTEAPTAPDVDPADVVWADEAFLNAAGVKEGKDVIYLPTPPMVVDKMIELANIKPTDVVWDLGTGDGRIAIEAARQKGCKAVGFEIDADLVAQARENVRKAGLADRVSIEERDILTLDFSEVDVVLMFLNPELNVKLIPQLQKLKPGARVVSHDWGMSGKVEDDVVIQQFKSKEPDFINLHSIYMWTAPLRLTE